MKTENRPHMRGINIVTAICGILALGGALALGLLEEKHAEKNGIPTAAEQSAQRRDVERRGARVAEPAITDATAQ